MQAPFFAPSGDKAKDVPFFFHLFVLGERFGMNDTDTERYIEGVVIIILQALFINFFLFRKVVQKN